MEERKWEDLEADCLANVFGRVGLESLLLDIPFVCKSWHKVSLNPLCWKYLVFPRYYFWGDDTLTSRFMDKYGITSLCLTSFIKFIVDRSCKKASVVLLPKSCTGEALAYVADECPNLTILGIPYDLCFEESSLILKVIPKFKNLEALCMDARFIGLKEILVQVSFNCNNFCCLRADNAEISQDGALAIVTLFPKIKYLFLMWANMDRESLETILKGCKELVHLDVRSCISFEADEKILELTSHIKTFKHEGSILPFDFEGIYHDDIYDDYGSD